MYSENYEDLKLISLIADTTGSRKQPATGYGTQALADRNVGTKIGRDEPNRKRRLCFWKASKKRNWEKEALPNMLL